MRRAARNERGVKCSAQSYTYDAATGDVGLTVTDASSC